ncbi:MAG: HDOD domain-containing protein, partial [Desulfatirhabdiaceae bacterium]
MEIRRPIFDLFSNLKHIPTLPQILLQLIKVCNQENGGLKEIARIIEKDPALTGRVLKLTNSASYAPAHRINSVDGAVYFLGTNAIKNIAICSSIHTVLHGIQTKTAFNIKQFWWHSLRCAILAKRMAKKIQYRDPDEAFLSGMLHDIGQIVLWVNFPEYYSELLSIYWEQSELMVAEEIRLVASHAEIGAGLLDKWNFPSFVTDAVFYHHAPKNDVFHALPLVKLVYVANCLSGVSGQKNLEGVELAQSFFGMGPASVKSLMLQVDNELKIVAESLEIKIEPVHSEEIVTTSKDIEYQQKLSKEMEDQALLLGLLQNMLHADDEYAVLNDLYNGIQTLFDLPIVYFFIIDSDRKSLRGTS